MEQVVAVRDDPVARLGLARATYDGPTSLGRVLPDGYPIDGYMRDEHGFGRILDHAVISPRLQRLYEWSATELEQPGMTGLVRDGAPAYCWPADEAHVWAPPPLTPLARALAVATNSS